MRPPSRTGEIARGLAALAALLLLLAGLPAGLALVAGSPIPHSLPDWAQITATLMRPDTGNTLFLTVVKVIGWAAWFLFSLVTLTETAGYLRGRPARRLPGPIWPMQRLARDLVAMAAVLIATSAPLAGAPTASLTQHTASATAPARPPAPTASPPCAAADVTPVMMADRPVQPAGHTTPITTLRPWKTRVIKRGNTLWAIARHEYGSGTRYLRIFNASKHLTQPAGLPRLSDPARIYPGQHITIPNEATTRPAPEPPPGPTAQQPTRPATRPVPPSNRGAHGSGRLAPPGLLPAQRGAPVPRPPTSAARPAPLSPPAPPTPPSPPAAHLPSAGIDAGRAGTLPAAQPNRTRPAPAPGLSRQSGDGKQDAPAIVRLPSGGYIGLGLAAAISGALAATRLHRRRRRPTLSEWPDPNPTDPAPPPPGPVARARQAHLDTLAARGRPIPSDADLVAGEVSTPTPTELTVGVRDGQNLTINLSGLDVALTGPASLDVARAIVTELLATSHRYRVEVVIPAPDAQAIFAGTGTTPTELANAIPGLILTASLSAAITHLEAEFIHRARLMEATDQPDVPALRTTDPGEPLPALLLIATAPTTRDRGHEGLQAILHLGRRYCLGGLLLGTWTPGTTLTLAADGTITHADGPDPGAWTRARLFHLTATDAGAMFQVIQTAGGAPEPTAPPTVTPPGTEPPDTRPTGRPPRAAPGTRSPATPPPNRDVTETTTHADRPVLLRVLGAVRVEAAGTPVATGLRRIARDLLAYLALRPDGITRDHGIDALMPDRDLDTGTTMLHTAINNARKTLRAATGLSEPMFIIHTEGRYHLDPALIDVDLWRLTTAVQRARTATNTADRINALQQIPALYTAELAEDLTHEWAETERERLRRQATDALAHLARLLTDDHPDQALTTLEQAIGHDPYAEPLYRDVMTLQARLGRPDAVRRTYQLLAHRLADLDTEPSDDTHQLHLQLLRPPAATPAAVGSAFRWTIDMRDGQ